MSIEYRAIVKGEGETYQKGDQCRLEGITEWDLDMHLSWHEGDSYDADFAFSYCELRRPVTNDQPEHYSSPLAEVVAKLAGMEATTRNNEFESKQDKPQEWDAGDSPSVGKCEKLYNSLGSEYRKVDILAVRKDGEIIYRILDGKDSGSIKSHYLTVDDAFGQPMFRPLKTEPTESEKEAEEREKWVNDVATAIDQYVNPQNPVCEILGATYDFLKETNRLKESGK